MKKLFTFLLAMVMTLSMTACVFIGGNGEDNKESEPVEEVNVEDVVLEILENVWALYPEEEQFPVSGGNMEYHIEQMEQDASYMPPNAPGKYDMAYAENLPYVLYIPAEQLENIDAAATMTHAMMANNFSSGVVHVKSGVDTKEMANAIKDNLAQTQWICGTPDQMLVAVVDGEYLLVAFGINDAMNPFVKRVSEAYPDADIIYSGSIIG